jgi:hypothetical protein
MPFLSAIDHWKLIQLGNKISVRGNVGADCAFMKSAEPVKSVMANK